jgi:DNA-binding NtrC family response regulator
MDGRILIADQEGAARQRLCEALTYDGFSVTCVSTREDALAVRGDIDVLIADVTLELVPVFQALRPLTEIVVLASPGHIDEALAAVRQGAFDLVLRPYFIEDVSLTVACAWARRTRQNMTIPLALIPRNHDALC